MIRIGNSPAAPHPVLVDLAQALGDALDRQQVGIVREYLDATRPGPWHYTGCPTFLTLDASDCECGPMPCAHAYGGHIGDNGATCGDCGARVDL